MVSLVAHKCRSRSAGRGTIAVRSVERGLGSRGFTRSTNGRASRARASRPTGDTQRTTKNRRDAQGGGGLAASRVVRFPKPGGFWVGHHRPPGSSRPPRFFRYPQAFRYSRHRHFGRWPAGVVDQLRQAEVDRRGSAAPLSTCQLALLDSAKRRRRTGGRDCRFLATIARLTSTRPPSP